MNFSGLTLLFNRMNRFFLAFAFPTLFFTGLYGCTTEPPRSTQPIDEQASLTKSSTGLHEITSFDVYVENNAIHILAGGKASADDKQGTFRYFHSRDGGLTWSQPVALNANLPKFINIRGNDVQLAASGSRLLALWQTKGELPGMGPLVTAYSEDGGQSWRQGGNPAVSPQGDQAHADLIADGQRNFHAVWLEDPEENGYQSLRYAFSSDAGKTWSSPATLDDSTCSCCWNTFSLSAGNTLNILYRDMKPRDMALTQSKDNGRSWRRAGLVGEFGWQFDGCPHTGGALAASGSSPAHLHSLVWTGLETKPGLYYLNSSDNGQSWSIPRKMEEAAIHGDIAAPDDDHVAAAWDEMGPNGSGIVFAKAASNGKNWQPPSRLTGLDVNATHPRLVQTANGYLIFWTEKSPGRPMQLVWKAVNK